MGNLTQKGKWVPWKGQWHWQTTKSVYIYTFVFTGTYTGPFCHNPVESRLIPLDSGSIPQESAGFLWNPVESSGMDAFLQESVGHQKVQGQSWWCSMLSKLLMQFWLTMQIHSFSEQHISSESMCLPCLSNHSHSCTPSPSPNVEVLAVPPLFLQESGHSSGMKFSRRLC